QEADYVKAKQAILTFERAENDVSSARTYFTDYTLKEATEILHMSEQQLLQQGLHIYTTFDPAIQNDAEKAVHTYMTDSELQIGTITMDVQTGVIRSMIGGRIMLKVLSIAPSMRIEWSDRHLNRFYIMQHWNIILHPLPY